MRLIRHVSIVYIKWGTRWRRARFICYVPDENVAVCVSEKPFRVAVRALSELRLPRSMRSGAHAALTNR